MTIEVIERRLTFRGGNLAAYNARDPEILLEGPAGTGKTFTILHKFHDLAEDHPGFRGLIVRKVAVTLGSSVLPTLEEEVFTEWDNYSRRSIIDGVSFYGGSEREAQAYVYANGSRLTVGGMDQASKVLGSFYDAVFFNQAEESTIEDLETLKTRLRHGLIPDNRLYCDCNPSASNHYLLKRCQSGAMLHLKSRLTDNPRYYDEDGYITPAGAAYLKQLEGLTGSRRQRLVLGEWTGVENAIYPHFDRELHVRPLEPGLIFQTGAIGADYGRRHNASVVPVRVDQYGRRWVFKAWAQPDRQHGRESEREIAQQRERYSISRLRVGPDMDIMIGLAGGEKSRIAEGSRQARTIEVAYLMGVFPGGLVPSSRDDAYNKPPASVTTRPDSPGLLFVEGGYGIEELCEEIENYHEVFVQSERAEQYVVARINDDRVSALEYACEELKDLSYFDFSIFAQGLGLATR